MKSSPYINFATIILTVCLWTLTYPSFSVALDKDNKNNSQNYVPNQILVKFVSGTSKQRRQKIRKSQNATLIKRIYSLDLELWRLPKHLSIEQVSSELGEIKYIKYVEPNYLYKPQNVPNDPEFEKLWYLQAPDRTIKDIAVNPEADVSATQAWDLETGSREVTIAVVDSGIALDHPDLEKNIWQNTDEIPGNGLDDDDNGYVDDDQGWDFVNDDNNPSDYSRDLYGDGHGTHISGIIAAEGNNGIGTTGLMWKSQIMPLKVFDLFQINTFSAEVIQAIRIISAIEYAVNNGADIINCSFGGTSFSNAMFDIFSYAEQKGVLVVAAAGNNSKNNDQYPIYPAGYGLSNIISVGATNEKNQLASYSNFGRKNVDVCAPGGGDRATIYSTVPPERKILFFDDFQSGGQKWQVSAIFENWFITYDQFFDSKVLRSSSNTYFNNEDARVVTKEAIDVHNCRGLHMQFDIEYSLEESYDFLFLEQSYDGQAFSREISMTGSSEGILQVTNWYDENQQDDLYLRFRLITDESVRYSGAWIDNFILTGIPWSFDGTEYDYKSGTSMATPVVAGLAGLLKSMHPNLNYSEVKEIIVNSVDHLSSLEGKIFSEGVVNCYRALVMAQGNSSPLPLIRVGNNSEYISISQDNPFSVTVELYPGKYTGKPAEWWIVANTPYGLFSYVHPQTWTRDWSMTIQAPFVRLFPFQVFSGQLPIGVYDFYFNIDDQIDGQLQVKWWDQVRVKIHQ